MKYVLSLVLVGLLAGCSWFTKNSATEGLEKSSPLSFSIEFAADEGNLHQTNVDLVLTNRSSRDLTIAEPTCLGVNVMPHAVGPDGRPLQMQFRIRVNCEERTIDLKPGVSHTTRFGYMLEECFDVSARGTYRVFFEYTGQIYDTTGSVSTTISG